MKRKVSEVHNNLSQKRRDNNFYQAAERGDLQSVLAMIQENLDINNIRDDWTQNTLLHGAASQGHIEVVNALLAQDADVNLTNVYRETPLYLAAKEGHAEVVKVLLANNAKLNNQDAGIDEDLLKERGKTPSPLYIASSNGHTAVVKLLLENHADVNERNNYDRTALHTAAIDGHTEIMKLLLLNQADIDAQDATDGTPLHMAISNGHSDAVELLLANNADILIVDEDEMDSLKHAIARYLYGYVLTMMFMQKRPSLKALESYQQNIPLLIKDGNNNIWIYGLTPEKKVSLTQLNNAINGYEDIVFSLDPMLDTKEVHPAIYLEIASKGGHSDACASAILKLLMIYSSKLENQGNRYHNYLLSTSFEETKLSAPLITEYYHQRHFFRNHYTMCQTHTFFQPSVDKNKNTNAYNARYPDDIELIFTPS